MTTVGDLIARIKFLLRDPPDDTDNPAWSRNLIATQLDESFLRMARRGLWGEIGVLQAVLNRTTYPLQEQGLWLAGGRDNSGGTGALNTVTDTTADFVTVGVAVDDVVRNATDGSRGVVTAVAATVLTCSAGFSGGTTNVVDTGDLYLVERAGGLRAIVSIDTVLYNGFELAYATEATLEKRLGSGWEMQHAWPRYWTVDHTLNPTVLRISPAPRLTGSMVPVIPSVPLPLPWEDNLVVFWREHPVLTLAEEVEIPIMEAFHDIAVWQTAQALSDNEGDQQDLSIALVSKELATLFLKQLGIS